jgi:hypothetical protein
LFIYFLIVLFGEQRLVGIYFAQQNIISLGRDIFSQCTGHDSRTGELPGTPQKSSFPWVLKADGDDS